MSRLIRFAMHRTWISALLSFILPGTLLACILHCSVPFPWGAPTDEASPFVCGHTLAFAQNLPPALSPGLIQSLTQGDLALAALLILALRLQDSLRAHTPLWQRRMGDAPPVPPPRRLCQRNGLRFK
ncbi:hypothetical protein A9Q02_12870 [Candidatus Chloroploca asiatica]|uniref:Uncharacterized protein n=2 Tax=Candidatus Chloroploca asiatica TaxID=1506545 RepID=A0A2H3KPA1_9CHLR|nr:hypothetical protein A9Q02_12870 [Candidatus Chloroploca asiatica]